MRRAALIIIVAAGIALLVIPAARVPIAIVVIVAAIAAWLEKPKPDVATGFSPSPPAETAGKIAGPTPRLTTLVATVNPANMSDLQRVLAGIISDERGKLVSSNGGPIVATFGSASAAVHAAQRMLSNVDALGRRLDRLIALTVGIDNSVDDATRLEQMTHEKRIAVLVSAAAASGSSSLAEVESGLFSFTPVQQRLF